MGNQENFVCEYWFNVDCSQAESFYGLNDNIGVEQGGGLDDAASSSSGQYASPPSEAASSPSGGYSSPSSGAASSPTGGYASPPSDGPLAGYTSLRTGRREGRVLSGARKNSVQSSFQGTKLRNSNSRFQNFPATVRKGKGNTRIVESKKQTRKDVGNTRDTNAGRRQKELSSDAKILTITSKNFFQRGGNQKNQNKLNKSIKSPSTLRSINLKLKKKERKRRPFNKVSKIENSQRVEPQLNRSGKSFSKRKQSKNKIGRSGRQEVTTGYLPPIDNSYSAGDATLAASSPDYDYEEAPLPTYAGASDSAGQSSYIAPAADTGYAAGSADTAYEAPAHSGGDVDALADAVYEEEPLPTYNRASSGSSSGYKAPVPDSVYESGSDFQRIFSLLITMGFITMPTLRVPVIQLHLMILMGLLPVIPMGLLLMIPMGPLLVIPMGHLLMIRTEFLQSLQMMDMGVLLALIMRMMYFPSITMVSITLAQNPQLQVVPAAPTISLEDYNIQEVSDKGFGGVGG